jgi:hypothetical protein
LLDEVPGYRCAHAGFDARRGEAKTEAEFRIALKNA